MCVHVHMFRHSLFGSRGGMRSAELGGSGVGPARDAVSGSAQSG